MISDNSVNKSESALGPWIICIVYVDRGARYPISWPSITTVDCGQRIMHFRGQIGGVCDHRPPQFDIANG